jgi:methyl-accepting chemotaxis protein WspA
MSIAGEIAAGNIDEARAQIGMLGVEPTGAPGRDTAELSRFRDEVWQLASVFAHMTNSLHSLVLQVQRSGIQVLASSTEISASSRQMEATATQQAASTNQVNITAREISSSCRLLLESVNRVLTVASETLSLAQEGQSRLSGMKSTMEELTKATSSIASQLDGISETAGSIGAVITTMTKVADQTNLLSLNATIEAEKAGKYGLGFSVVAREIQRLADQTAVATLDIENLVRKMGATVSTGVAEMDEFVMQVRKTVQEVETISSELVSSIINHLHELLPRFKELGSAMDAQSAGADEISKAMNQLSEGAEQTRMVIHDFTNVTQQLITAADELQQEVSRFKATSARDEGPA